MILCRAKHTHTSETGEIWIRIGLDQYKYPGLIHYSFVVPKTGGNEAKYMRDFSVLCLLTMHMNPQQRRQWHPTPVSLPGKSHGWRSLLGCSPWGRNESDTTERLHFHFSLSCIGEWNGNPLQCSCVENPRDGRASWAAVCGAAQSRTWLKRLSSSSRNPQWSQWCWNKNSLCGAENWFKWPYTWGQIQCHTFLHS